MKSQIVISVLLYTLSIVAIFALFFYLLDTDASLLSIGVVILIASLILGYILNSYILSQKFSRDENLLHLTKEILHELNIPISTIQANSMLLKRGIKGDKKGIERLNRIDNSTKRLKRLYSELIYSIKREIQEVEREEVQLKNLIEERVNELRLLNRNPFELDLEPITIWIDRIGFEKMLDNILINAMKYSSKEKPITIKLKNTLLTIEDRGIGMDESELIAIYDRYYQSDSSAYGEGIGLALVKAYCDDEKIKMWINSKKGVGTKFSLDLSNSI